MCVFHSIGWCYTPLSTYMCLCCPTHTHGCTRTHTHIYRHLTTYTYINRHTYMCTHTISSSGECSIGPSAKPSGSAVHISFTSMMIPPALMGKLCRGALLWCGGASPLHSLHTHGLAADMCARRRCRERSLNLALKYSYDQKYRPKAGCVHTHSHSTHTNTHKMTTHTHTHKQND